MTLPTGAKDRKDIPLYWGLVNYFRDALIAIAKLSMIGNEQHNPGEPLRWNREKGGDELDAEMRHLFQIGGIDYDLVPHSVKNAWRALAVCQIELEETPWNTPVAEIVKLIRARRLAPTSQGICAPAPTDEAFASCQIAVIQSVQSAFNHEIVKTKAFGPFPGMPEASYFAKSLRANSSAPISFITLTDVSKLRTKKC